VPDEKLEGTEETAEKPEESAEETESEETATKKSEKIFTESDVNRIVQERLHRSEAAMLKRHGITQDIQAFVGEYNELLEEKKRRDEETARQAEEEAIKRGQHEKVIAELKQGREEDKRTLQTALDQQVAKYNKMVIDRELGEAHIRNGGLENALGPAQAAMQAAGVVFDVQENNKIVLKDATGTEMTDGNGETLTVDGFVKNFLREHPFFTKAAQSQGSGAPRGLDTPGVPLSAKETDDYVGDRIAKGDDTAEIAKELGIDN